MIISDDNFKHKCEVNFKQIFSDGVIDKDDIPLIVNLILNIYQNYTKIRVSNVNLKPLFMLLLSKLINEFKGESTLDEQMILLLLEPQVDLLLLMLLFQNVVHHVVHLDQKQKKILLIS